MLANKISEKSSLVWKGLSLDNYPLQLTQTGLDRITEKLSDQPELKNYVKRHYQGNIKQAVTRSIAQLARDALYTGCVSYPDFSKKLRVFKTEGIQGRNYHILAFPLSKTESAIVSVETEKQAAVELESGPATAAWLTAIINNIDDLTRSYADKDYIQHLQRQVQETIRKLNANPKLRIGKKQVDVQDKPTQKPGQKLNRPDISFVHNGKRVNIEIDTDMSKSQTHQKEIIAQDPNAIAVFYVISKDDASLKQIRYYKPGQEVNQIFP